MGEGFAQHSGAIGGPRARPDRDHARQARGPRVRRSPARTAERRRGPARGRAAPGGRQGHADDAVRLGRAAGAGRRSSSTARTATGRRPARRSPSCSTTPPTPATRRRSRSTDGKLLALEARPRRAADDDDRRAGRVRAGRPGQPRVPGRARRSTTGVDDTQPGDGRHLERGQLRRPEEDRTRRLARPLCFLRADPTDNGYVRPDRGPAAGRRPEHDAGHPRRGVRPLAAAAGRGATTPPTASPTSATDIKPLEITQPEGPSFEVDGLPGGAGRTGASSSASTPARA